MSYVVSRKLSEHDSPYQIASIALKEKRRIRSASPRVHVCEAEEEDNDSPP